MFKIVSESERTYFWPVEIFIPRSGGKKVKAVVECEFKLLPQTEQNEIIGSAADIDDDTLWRVLVGWKEGHVQDEAGSVLPYSDEAKRTFLNIPYVRASVARGYFNSVNGAREKN